MQMGYVVANPKSVKASMPGQFRSGVGIAQIPSKSPNVFRGTKVRFFFQYSTMQLISLKNFNIIQYLFYQISLVFSDSDNI